MVQIIYMLQSNKITPSDSPIRQFINLPARAPYTPFPKNVNAATTYPSIPTVSVGCTTGAKNGL